MNPIRPAFTLTIVSIALVTPILLHPLPSIAQQPLEFNGFILPLPVGATASAARGISERGWEPLTICGTVDTPVPKGACWIRVSNVWTGHVLSGITATGESWASAVDHVPAVNGEWTLVVGAAKDATGLQHPMRWMQMTDAPWDAQQLPTPAGVIGEAVGLFIPDVTSLRAFVCGWTSESATTTAPAGETDPKAFHLRQPVLWNTRSTGSIIVYPDFGAGLEGVINDGASSGTGVFMAAGGGQNIIGEWKPQLWRSTDDGETWSNEEIPLPFGVSSGELTDWDHEVGHWQGAGWGKLSATGTTVPLLWDLDDSTPLGTWVIHQLPLPANDEGGLNGYVHKLPGRVKYANIVLKQGINPEAGIWIDNPTGGFTLLEPADYLLNPQIGTPVAPAGMDKLGRVAVKFVWLPSGAPSSAVANNYAGVLFPSPPTGIGDGGSAPSLIALSASPNPFKSGVRIAYTLPRDAVVTMTVHDVAGRVVARLDQGALPGGQERVVQWDGVSRDGRRAASGVYFVRVETPYETSTMKIVRVE